MHQIAARFEKRPRIGGTQTKLGIEPRCDSARERTRVDKRARVFAGAVGPVGSGRKHIHARNAADLQRRRERETLTPPAPSGIARQHDRGLACPHAGHRFRTRDLATDTASGFESIPLQKFLVLDDVDAGRPAQRGDGGPCIGGPGDHLGQYATRRFRAGKRWRAPAHLHQPRRKVEIADREVLARMRNQQPRPDYLGIIARYVRDREIEGAARGDALCEPASLDARDAFAHAIDRADRMALGQQVFVHPREVRSGESVRQDLDERGGAARCQGQHVRLGGDRVDEVDEGTSCRKA